MSFKHVQTRYIHGALTHANQFASDLSWLGLLAFGCRNLIVVVHANTGQLVQTLSSHHAPVILVKWWHEVQPYSSNVPYTLKLASADTSGMVYVWDVKEAQALTYFQVSSSPKQPLVHIEWMNQHEGCRDSLAVLTSSGTLAVWNSGTGSCIWKKNVIETAISLQIDPFDYTRMLIQGSDHFLLITDSTPYKLPQALNPLFLRFLPPGYPSHSKQSIDIHLSTERPPKNETSTPHSNLLALHFSKFHRNVILLLYRFSIVSLHLTGGQALTQITLEKGVSPFLKILLCKQRDAIYGLHENCSLSFRLQQSYKNSYSTDTNEVAEHHSTELLVASPTTRAQRTLSIHSMEERVSNSLYSLSSSSDFCYELKCQADVLREVTRNARQVQLNLCLATETRIVILFPESKIQVWELTPKSLGLATTSTLAIHQAVGPIYIDTAPEPRVMAVNSLSSFLASEADLLASELYRERCHIMTFSFSIVSYYEGLFHNPTCIRMGPAMTTKNKSVYKPFLAVGSHQGRVQIFNLYYHTPLRAFSVLNCPVTGIQWTSMYSMLIYGHTEPALTGLVRNEISYLDLTSGESVSLRKGHLSDPDSPIDCIRVSNLKQYFLVVFKDKPLEYWDLFTLMPLRILTAPHPITTAVEWAPANITGKLKAQHAQRKQGGGETYQQEVYLMADLDGILYQIIAEGTTLREASRFSPETAMGIVTSISWKGDLIVIGDSDGNLSLWDTKTKKYKMLQSVRGGIKQLRIGPGKGNFKIYILSHNWVEIKDIARNTELCGQLKQPFDACEWVNPDKLCLLNVSEGWLRISDLAFLQGNDPYMKDQQVTPFFCPHLMQHSKPAFLLRTLLQHQPWMERYSVTSLKDLLLTSVSVKREMDNALHLIPDFFLSMLTNVKFGVAERCCVAAVLYGDSNEHLFWVLALHYLRKFKRMRLDKKEDQSVVELSLRPAKPKQQSSDLFVPERNALERITSSRECLFSPENSSLSDYNTDVQFSAGFPDSQKLELSEDLLCDLPSYQLLALKWQDILEANRRTPLQTRACAAQLIQINEADRAVQLLLETEPNDPSYHVDSLRACLVATIRSSGASQSTIKLVATSLIANGHLNKGVELLCLIDKGIDACRYLQTYNKWYEAAHLAKSTLSATECHEVFMRWADHLISPMANRQQGVLVYLSLFEFQRVLEMLYAMRYFERAALLVEACMEFDVLDCSIPEIQSVCEAIFLEYARVLFSLDYFAAAEYYAGKSGDNGRKLLDEFRSKQDELDSINDTGAVGKDDSLFKV